MKEKITILIIFLLPLIILLSWFRNWHILGGGEEGLIFYDIKHTAEISSSIWRENNTGYSTHPDISRVPFYTFLNFLSNLNIPPVFLQFLTFFILMEIGIFSIYFLVKNDLSELTKKQYLLPLISALFYLLNPYTMSQIWGRGLYIQYFPFALFPLALLLTSLGLNNKNLIFSLFIILSSFGLSVAFGNISYPLSFWIVLTLYHLFFIINNKKDKDKIVFAFVFFGVTLIGWLITQLWWILPILHVENSGYNLSNVSSEENLASLRGVSGHFPFQAVIRLVQHHYFYLGKSYGEIYSSIPFLIISWVIPLVALFSLKFIRNNKPLRFFVGLFLLGLFVSIGINWPTGFLFELLVSKFSILQVYRNPYEKFGLVFLIGYVPFFALGVINFANYLSKKFSLNEQKNVSYIFIFTILFLVYLVNIWPLWTGTVIAGPGQKIGLTPPNHYSELQKWLEDNNKEGDRLFMAPFTEGDGVNFIWGDRNYVGFDPTSFLVKNSAVSTALRLPYSHDLTGGIRRYMDRVNVVPALSLLRTKYLIIREEHQAGEKDYNQINYLTQAIYPPNLLKEDMIKICESKKDIRDGIQSPFINCELTKQEGDWSKTRYLHVFIKTDLPSAVEVAFVDDKLRRPRWDGAIDKDYEIKGGEAKELILPIGSATEIPAETDFSSIKLVSIKASPVKGNSVPKNLEVESIWIDSGVEEKINEYSYLTDIGKLKIYSPQKYNPPPDLGIMFQLIKVENIEQLLVKANELREETNKTGFLVESQNKNKKIENKNFSPDIKIEERIDYSNTRFFIKLEGDKNTNLILNKTFSSGWKVIPNIKKEELVNNFNNNINLISKKTILENDHYVVNGYANFWILDNNLSNYAIVYMPQVLVELGYQISLIALAILSVTFFVFTLILRIVKKNN